MPIAGQIAYSLDPEWIDHRAAAWTATEKTYVEFKGRTAWAQRSEIPFHVTSLDWQESDRVLAGIMTAFGAPTGAIDIGGRGEFDGVMLEAFSRPRIEGHFAGDRMRAWDTIWGHGVADLVIENSYVDITKQRHRAPGIPHRRRRAVLARLPAQGRRRGDQRATSAMNEAAAGGSAARLRARRLSGRRPDVRRVPRLRPVSRAARRRRACRSTQGTAYGEPFEIATANLRFEGAGVRLDKIDITEEHRRRHRRGVGRLGRQLLVRRERREDPRRVARDADLVPARAARRASSGSTRPAPARSTIPATT